MPQKTTVGQYLIRRLEDLGVEHVFGVPGDYVLRFYDMLVESKLTLVGTCTEAGAGFAADAYARVNGLGVACVTYCVGGFNLLNSTAGAYAEESPLVIISGAPGIRERMHSPLLHHRVKDFNTQRLIFEKVTAAAVALEDPTTIPREVDKILNVCVTRKRPVFIEIPRDMVTAACDAPQPWKAARQESDALALGEAVEEAAAMIRRAKRPVVLGGVEIHRYGLQGPFLKLIEEKQLPVAATLLGKSIIRENHPQYLGIYEGGMGREDVQRAVESADCIIILGAFLTDIDLGIYTAHLDPARVINANSERISIKYHSYDDVVLKDFIDGLHRADLGNRKWQRRVAQAAAPTFTVAPKEEITVKRLFERINTFLSDDHIVICDPGDSLFGAADLVIHRHTEFISPAYYTSMGFAVPAAIGAQINKRRLRPVVFVGDGAFQMTGMELSTIARLNLNPIIFVLNNKGYATERMINDGPYNDIHEWAYHKMADLLQSGWGCEVRTEAELENAIEHVEKHKEGFALVNVHLDPYDASRAMSQLGKRLGRQVGKKQ